MCRRSRNERSPRANIFSQKFLLSFVCGVGREYISGVFHVMEFQNVPAVVCFYGFQPRGALVVYFYFTRT